MGGKVLVPTGQHIRTLNAARLAADVAGRADAGRRPHRRAGRDAADQRRRRARPRVPHRRAAPPRASTRCATASSRCIARGLAYAPYADLLWWRPRSPTSRWRASSPRPSRRSSRTRCWPTTARRRSTGRSTWTTRRSRSSSASSAHMGYKFQFITLAGFHALNYSMFDLAHGLRPRRHDRLRRAAGGASSPRRAAATPRPSTSARSAPATSTGSRPPSTRTSATTRARGLHRRGAVPLTRPRPAGGTPLRRQAASLPASPSLHSSWRHPMVDRLNYRIEVTGPVEGRFAEILTPEALAFLAQLDDAFAGRRHELLDARRSGATDLHPARSRSASCAETRRIRDDEPGGSPRRAWPGGPPRRDHRPDRPQDDDQRAELRREGLAGRLRGRDVPDLGTT